MRNYTKQFLGILFLLLTVSPGISFGAPDGSFRYRFTNRSGETADNVVTFAPGAGPAINNTNLGCISWQLTYASEGFSALSITLQTAPAGISLAGTPTPSSTWSTFSGTDTLGTLAMTGTSQGNYVGYGFFPYLRVNVTTTTGTGSIEVKLSCWNSITYANSIGSGGGGSGDITAVTAGCGLGGGGSSGAVTVSASRVQNAQTGTTDTIADDDCGKYITYSNAAAIAVTLPQANGSTFVSGWHVTLINIGAGLVTVTPTTSTINGSASITIPQYQALEIFSNGTNYFSNNGRPSGELSVTSISSGSSPPACVAGTAGVLCLGEGTAPTGLTSTAEIYSKTDHLLYANLNNGGEVQIPTASSAATFTNKTYDTAGTGNTFKINGTTISAVSGTGAVCLASGSSCGGGGTGGVKRVAYASLPTCDSSVADSEYIFTDGAGVVAHCNGTSHSYFYNGIPVTLVPTAANWTAVGTGTTKTDKAGTIILSGVGDTADNWHSIMKAVPGSTPYTITIGYRATIMGSSNSKACGLAVGNGTTTGSYIQVMEFYQDSTNAPLIRGSTWSTYAAGSFVANLSGSGALFNNYGDTIWMRYTDDGTNRHFYTAPSKQGPWAEPFGSETRTNNYTATHYGIACRITDAYPYAVQVFDVTVE